MMPDDRVRYLSESGWELAEGSDESQAEVDAQDLSIYGGEIDEDLEREAEQMFAQLKGIFYDPQTELELFEDFLQRPAPETESEVTVPPAGAFDFYSSSIFPRLTDDQFNEIARIKLEQVLAA